MSEEVTQSAPAGPDDAASAGPEGDHQVLLDATSLNTDTGKPDQRSSSEKERTPGSLTANEADDELEDEDRNIENYEYSDDFEEITDEDDNGVETDIEDNDEQGDLYSILRHRHREANPDLPSTVTELTTDWGSKVYLVGTCHFSTESQEDVAKTISATQPDVVMVELCHNRMNILSMDEEKLLEEAKNINMEKLRMAIKQSGMVQGVMHLLFLSMSAHLTKELGMAPGGEFRRAFKEAQKIPGCRLQLGDRPINITLRRALSSLSIWQKLKLGFALLMSKDPISKEDIEKCKQKDLLEEMLREMTGEFPALSRVFIQERDTFLANALQVSAQPVQHRKADGTVLLPTVVVGVVGIGHVPGIVANWKEKEFSIQDIMQVPEGGMFGKILKLGIRLSLLGLMGLACYRLYRWTSPMIT